MKKAAHTVMEYEWVMLCIGLIGFFITGMFFENLPIMVLPLLILLALLMAYYPLGAFYLFVFSIPFTNDYPIIWGFSLDLPAEPFMMFLTAIGGVLIILKSKEIPWGLVRNSLVLLIVVGWCWSLISMFFSTNFTVSLKYVLAKSWFIIPCFFLFLLFLYEEKDQVLKRFAQTIVWAMVISSAIIFTRHTAYGLSYDSINKVVVPLFRNHVTYACVLILSLPWAYYLFRKSDKYRSLYGALCLWFSVCIYFSFTRVVMGALVISSLSLVLLKWKLVRPAIVAALVTVAIALIVLIQQKQYIEYAPDFNKTITHHQFDDLLDATAKGQDISTAERFHRWVAGYHMLEQKPIVGFGPGTFYFSYKRYTESQFRTYVSRNDEKSGIHNYYLMLAVEQGIMGTILFVLLLITAFLKIENLERKHPMRPIHRVLFFSLVSILLILTLNDMIETVHVGTFFFIVLSIIVFLDYSVDSIELNRQQM